MNRLACLALLCVSVTTFAEEKADRAAARKAFQKGNAAYEKQAYRDAIEHYSKALASDPALAAAYQQRGICYFMTSRFKESVADFDHYLKFQPKEAPRHWQRGIALYY